MTPKFQRGDLVRKVSGSEWEGHVVGEYSTALTPEGYAVESMHHKGSVQIYPAAALTKVAETRTAGYVQVIDHMPGGGLHWGDK